MRYEATKLTDNQYQVMQLNLINNPKETVPTYTVVKGDYLIRIGKKTRY